MRTRLLCSLLVLLSCAKRINPDPGVSRTTWSGVPVRFGQSQEIPEGTQIVWDFGDGTPPQQGVSAVHAYPRAGVYTVVETVRDKDGQTRSGRTHVAVLRRTVPMAVPPDVRATFEWTHIEGDLAIRWRRIGGHRIFKNP